MESGVFYAVHAEILQVGQSSHQGSSYVRTMTTSFQLQKKVCT
jgi:hypothetical protein